MQKLDITKVSAIVTIETGAGQLTLNIVSGSNPKTLENAAELLRAKFLEVVERALGASFADQSKLVAQQEAKILELQVALDEAIKPKAEPAPKKSKPVKDLY